MDLVNIRKKAQEKKEKEKKEKLAQPEEVSLQAEEEIETAQVIEKEEAEPIQKETAEIPAPPREAETPEKIVDTPEKTREEIHEITTAPSSEEEDEIEVISFQLGAETYGVKIERVKEILRHLEMTPLPRTPDYLKGITSLRGEIIPVFDLKKRLGLEGDEVEEKTKILILRVKDETMGVLIDEVNGVIKIHKKSIEPPPAVITGVEADFLEGVSRTDNKFIGLLNVEEVLKI